jgi:shikimate kinase
VILAGKRVRDIRKKCAAYNVAGQMTEIAVPNDANATAAVLAALGHRSVVLIGIMGVGKSSIGRRLAGRFGIPFVDADAEIEKAAGMTIADIFAHRGEADFRSGEARVIARLLEGGPQVLAAGGGAFMNAGTRAAIRAKGVSVWLKADLDVLLRRISKRRNERPLLQTGDPEDTLRALLTEREPIYAQADVTVYSRDVAHDSIVADIITALGAFLHDSALSGEKSGA